MVPGFSFIIERGWRVTVCARAASFLSFSLFFFSHSLIHLRRHHKNWRGAKRQPTSQPSNPRNPLSLWIGVTSLFSFRLVIFHLTSNGLGNEPTSLSCFYLFRVFVCVSLGDGGLVVSFLCWSKISLKEKMKTMPSIPCCWWWWWQSWCCCLCSSEKYAWTWMVVHHFPRPNESFSVFLDRRGSGPVFFLRPPFWHDSKVAV